MKIQIDRDSVSAGDDSDLHEELRRFEPQMKIAAVVYYIAASGFLPRMNKENASWKVVIKEKLIAVICGDCSQIYFSVEPSTELQKLCPQESEAKLDFKYLTNPAESNAMCDPSWSITGPVPFGL